MTGDRLDDLYGDPPSHRMSLAELRAWLIAHGKPGGRLSRLTTLIEFNPYHEPAGSPEGGQFASTPGSELGGMQTQTTSDTLSAKDQKKYEAHLKNLGLSHQDLVEEILSRLAPNGLRDEALLQEAQQWYPDAHTFAQSLRGLAPITIEQAIGVIAATSPQNAWFRKTQYGPAGNKRDAEFAVKYFNEHQGETSQQLVKGFRALYDVQPGGNNEDNHLGPGLSIGNKSYEKAFKIMLDGSRTNIQKILGTLKTASFYNNIMWPGRTSDVTIDSHMSKSIVYAGLTRGLGVIPKDADMAKASQSALKDVLFWMKPNAWGSTGHALIADAARAVAKKLNVSTDTVQAAYWLAVQPADPWHNVKAGIKGVGKKKTAKAKTVSEDTVMPSERPEGFLLTVSRYMPWGDGPPLTEEEMDERTLGPGIRNTIPLWERYVDDGTVNA